MLYSKVNFTSAIVKIQIRFLRHVYPSTFGLFIGLHSNASTVPWRRWGVGLRSSVRNGIAGRTVQAVENTVGSGVAREERFFVVFCLPLSLCRHALYHLVYNITCQETYPSNTTTDPTNETIRSTVVTLNSLKMSSSKDAIVIANLLSPKTLTNQAEFSDAM